MDHTSPTITHRPEGVGEQSAQAPEGLGQQAADAAHTAKDQAGEVATTAKDAVIDITSTAKDQAATVRQDVAAQGRQLLDEAKGQAATTADHQVSKVSSSLTSITDQVNALLDGRPEDAGQVKEIAQRAVREVNTLAERLDQRGLDGILTDVRSFARRKPGTFLLLAGAAGIGVGLVARGAKAGSQSDTTTTTPGGLEPIYPPSMTDLPPLPPIAPAPPIADPWARGTVS